MLYCLTYNFSFRFPVHRRRSVIDFVSKHNDKIVMLDWPKPFGDFMPLEIVWMKMGDEFSKGNIKSTDEESLWREIKLMWQTLCKDVLSFN